MMIAGLLLTASMPIVAPAEQEKSETTARRFVAAVKRGSDPVSEGIVPSLTEEQSERLVKLQRCSHSLLSTSTVERTRIIWQCGSGRQATAWMTELNFEGATISSIEIVPLVMRPTMGQ